VLKTLSGLAWRSTAKLTERSRRRKFQLFMELFAPTLSDRILDVGVAPGTDRSTNFLETWYPWPSQITAVGLDRPHLVSSAFPEVRYVQADGRQLPFRDSQFDIGFSNAVIEHAGSRREQALFASELVRVCRRVFLATPNRFFPVDPHTLLPFVHWLPAEQRRFAYERLGKRLWAPEEHLNPLSAADLRVCFGGGLRIIRQRLFGLASNLIAVVDEDLR
jgi:hypothetical protein